MREYRILSLGAGVQSTVLALMGVRGEIKIDAAIFADTGAEPKAVMKHLEWLVKECSPVFPVYIRQKSNIIEDFMAKDSSDGKRHFVSAPFFTANDDGSKGIGRRQCTSEYKVNVVDRCIKREVLGLAPRQRIPADVKIIQLIGMSAEEGRRVVRVKARFASARQAEPEFPLHARWMTRADCVQWLKDYGVPHEVPRSACIFCPYKSDAEWVKLRSEWPDEWEKVKQLDKAIRDKDINLNRNFKSNRYLHRSCLPIDQVKFQPKLTAKEQATFPSMADECEGMCGV